MFPGDMVEPEHGLMVGHGCGLWCLIRGCRKRVKHPFHVIFKAERRVTAAEEAAHRPSLTLTAAHPPGSRTRRVAAADLSHAPLRLGPQVPPPPSSLSFRAWRVRCRAATGQPQCPCGHVHVKVDSGLGRVD